MANTFSSTAGQTLVQDVSGVLTGANGKIYPTFPASSGRFTSTAFTFMLKSVLPTFGSSTPDTTVSRTQSGTTYYYDTVRGLDTNTGLSAAQARKTLPQYLTANNSKYMIAAGSTVSRGKLPLIPTAANVVVTCYDGDPLSSKYGQEITDQPNPFIRAQLGGWVSDYEKQTKYWTLDLGFTATDTISSITTSAVAANSCADFLLRGVVIKGCPSAIYAQTNGNALRVEDFVIDSAQTNPDLNSNKFGGVGIRWDTATQQTGTLSVVRFFAEHIGEDFFHAVYPGSSPVTVSDFAVVHTCDQQKYSSQHADVFQFGANPGAFTIKRGVIAHTLQPGPLTINDSGVSTPVGGIVVQTGTQSTVTTGGTVQDVIFITGGQISNIFSQAGVQFSRCVGLAVPTPTAITSAMLTWSVNGSESDCVWAVQDAKYGAYVRAILNNSTVTRTNVTEIPSFGG